MEDLVVWVLGVLVLDDLVDLVLLGALGLEDFE